VLRIERSRAFFTCVVAVRGTARDTNEDVRPPFFRVFVRQPPDLLVETEPPLSAAAGR
jgi:hypothetical protein